MWEWEVSATKEVRYINCRCQDCGQLNPPCGFWPGGQPSYIQSGALAAPQGPLGARRYLMPRDYYPADHTEALLSWWPGATLHQSKDTNFIWLGIIEHTGRYPNCVSSVVPPRQVLYRNRRPFQSRSTSYEPNFSQKLLSVSPERELNALVQ